MRIIKFLTAAIIITVYTSGYAGICVEIDTEKDQLLPVEKASAKIAVEQEFIAEHKTIGEPCEDTVKIYHLIFGDSVAIMLYGKDGSKKAVAPIKADMPAAYANLVKAYTGKTSVQAIEKDVFADLGGTFYAKVGLSLILGNNNLQPNPYIGFGYRYPFGALVLDASFLNTSINIRKMPVDDETRIGSNDCYFSVTRWLQASILYYTTHKSTNSFYTGGGASFESYNVSNGYYNKETIGAGANIIFGWEFFRQTRFRLFTQLEIDLPFVKASLNNTRKFYMPSANISCGGGF